MNKTDHKKWITDQIGKKFNKLTVISYAGFIKDSSGSNRSYFNCLCDYGGNKKVKFDYLRKNEIASCGCLHKKENNPNWLGYGELSGDKFRTYKDGAVSRDIIFNITIEYCWNLFILQKQKCALSGIDISFSKTANPAETTASLDRIDSSTGYIEGNVQWVHKDINRMKMHYSKDYYIQTCKLVAEYNK